MNHNVLATNRIRKDEYTIVKRIEIGFVLTAIEVKMVNQKSLSINGSYVRINNNVAYIHNMHIHITDSRVRMLLMHKKEIINIYQQLLKGMVLIPETIYKKNNLIKGEFILAKYQRKNSKRDKILDKQIYKQVKEHTYGKISV